MSSYKKLTCKGTLRRVYRLDISTVSHIGIFDPALWTIAPLTYSLVQLFPSSPLPFVNKYTVYTFTVCKGEGGYGVLALRQINICREVPLQINYFRWPHFASPSMRFIFLQVFGWDNYSKHWFRASCWRSFRKSGKFTMSDTISPAENWLWEITSDLVQVLKVDIIQGLAITRGKIKDWCKYFCSPKFYKIYKLHKIPWNILTLFCAAVYKPDPYVRVRVVGTPNPAQETRHITNTLTPR